MHHEHIFFLIHPSFSNNTRTRTTSGTTRSTPRTPSASSTSPKTTSRKAPLSRTTLSWRPAEWRKPSQHILHRLWAQGARDGLKDLKDNRSILIIWCTEGIRKTRSSSSDHRRSEFGEIETHGLPDYQSNDSKISGVLLSIAHALWRFRRKHCRFWSRRWRVTKDANFTPVCPDSLGNPMHWSCRREIVLNWLKPEKKVWGAIHLKVRKLLGKPDAWFSSEQETLIRSSVFRNANPSNLRGSLHEGNKDHLAKQESFVSSLSISALVNYNDKQKSKDWRYRTHSTDLSSLDETKFDHKKNCLWKKKVSETLKSEICTKWEQLNERKNFE